MKFLFKLNVYYTIFGCSSLKRYMKSEVFKNFIKNSCLSQGCFLVHMLNLENL